MKHSRTLSISFVISLSMIISAVTMLHFSTKPSLAWAVGPVTVTATVGTSGPTDYATLKLAFDAINAGTHQGAITINIVGDTTETAPAALNASGSGAASYTTINIQPANGAARTISGAIAPGSPLIDFNGADNVTIDGLNSGGNSLTISNTTASATSGTSTIRFINGATNNTITNSNILGSFSGPVQTNGGNIFFSTDASTPNGNDNNTISHNNIGPAGSNLPTKGVSLNGTLSPIAVNNSGIVIDHNNIFDYFGANVTSAGVFVSTGDTDCNVTNNKFYQTGARIQTSGFQHSAIWLSTTGGNFQIVGNTIGFASSTGTGTYNFVAGAVNSVFIPIAVNAGGPLPTSLQGNTIAGIAMSGISAGIGSGAPFRGIHSSAFIGPLRIGDVTGNTIGSQSATGSITYTSSSGFTSEVIAISHVGTADLTVKNNNIGGITASNSSNGTAIVYGIRVNSSTSATSTLQDNNIGGTVANSLQSTTTAAGTQVVGIHFSTSRATVTGNTIRNLTAAGGTGVATAASVIGMNFVSDLVNNTVSQNTVHSLSNTNASDATTVTGIQYTSSTSTNLIARNFLHSFNAANSSAIINGIQVSGGTASYQNNMIRLGVDSAGASIVKGMQINGINEIAGTNNFYFNSVAIGGLGVTSTANTFALQSAVTANTRNYFDNIFVNSRQTTSGAGKNYAISVAGTTSNPSGLTSNSNVFNAPNSGGILGLFNGADRTTIATWRTATGQDTNSLDANPQFINPNGNASLVDLHINSSVVTVIEGNGLAIGSVADDFDGALRANLTPVDIGADAGNFMGMDLAPPVISYARLGNTTSTTTRILTDVSITDNSGVNGAPGTKPHVYYKKSTNANTFNDNTNATDGWKFVEASGVSSPFDFTFNYSLIFGGSVATGDTIQYFVVAQDLAAVPNVGINSGVFAAQPSSVALTSAAFPIGGAINSYPITTTISGSRTACASGCDYMGLSNAGGLFADINSKVMAGNLTINVIGDLLIEDGANALNQWAEEGSGGYSLNIQASGGARVISGSAPVAPGVALIDLNGADRVTINGINSGGRSLLIRGTTNSATTIRLINDASNNSILNCTIEGGGTPVLWLSTGTVTGNDNNTISGNVIRDRSDAASLPVILVGSSNGLSTPLNSNNVFSNNQLKNFASNGLAAGLGNDNWTITNNNIFEESPRTSSLTGISFGGQGTNVISGNSIHDLNTSQGSADGMFISGPGHVTISGNRVYNFLSVAGSTASLAGINLQGSSSGAATATVVNNMVSIVPSFANDQTITGILVFGFPGNTFELFHNSIYVGGTASLSGGRPTYALLRGYLSENSFIAKNNIVYNNRTGAVANHFAAGDSSPNTGTFVSDFNFFAGTGTTAANFMYYGFNVISFPTWQTSPPPRDANSIAGTAASFNVGNIFVDAANGDLHLKPTATQMLGAGTPVSSVTTDIDNEPRPSSNPDIGADELVQPETVTTPTGTNVQVQGNGTTITFSNVTAAGSTTIALINPASAGTLPSGYQLFGSSIAFDITTTATVQPPISVCFSMPSVIDATAFSQLRLLHNESGSLIDRTTSTDFAAKMVCGVVSSLGPFVVAITPASQIQFNATSYSISEGAGVATLTVSRLGETSATMTVDYATADGTALQRTDYSINSGTVTFAPGQMNRNLTVLIVDDAYVEADETVNINLANANGAPLGTPGSVTLTIQNNDSAPPLTNPLDNADARFFVRQHYYDFLTRLPDTPGFEYWSTQIRICGTDQTCINGKRIDVSNAFYFELEFQQTGSYVYRVYRAAFGNNQPFPNPNPDPANPNEEKKVPLYLPFMRDRARVRGGAQLSQLQLDFATVFVQRAEFLAKYPVSLVTAAQFVDAVLATMTSDLGVDLSGQRQALIDLYGQGSTSTAGRANVMYRLADDNMQTNPTNNRAFIDAEYNRAFVFTAYSGYLRRNADMPGFLFWLGQVNGAPLRDIAKQHAMVCAFITATEYQNRFSSVVTHNNTECGQ